MRNRLGMYAAGGIAGLLLFVCAAVWLLTGTQEFMTGLGRMAGEKGSDILGARVLRPACVETTSLGAASLAGLAVGVYQGLDETADGWHVERKFVPAMDAERREELLHGWKRAVERSKDWAK